MRFYQSKATGVFRVIIGTGRQVFMWKRETHNWKPSVFRADDVERICTPIHKEKFRRSHQMPYRLALELEDTVGSQHNKTNK